MVQFILQAKLSRGTKRSINDKVLHGWGNREFDAFLIKLDTSGNEVWTKLYGTHGDDSLQSLVINADESIYLAGSTSGA